MFVIHTTRTSANMTTDSESRREGEYGKECYKKGTPCIKYEKKQGSPLKLFRKLMLYFLSRTMPMPCPPPMHSAASPYLLLRLCISYIRVTIILAPVQPIG